MTMRQWWVLLLAGLAVCAVAPILSSINAPMVEMSRETPVEPRELNLVHRDLPDGLLVEDTVYLTEGIEVDERLLAAGKDVAFRPGHLAAGVRVDRNGRLYGTPQRAGTYVASVEGCAGRACDQDDLTLVVLGNVPWQPRELAFPGRTGVALDGEIGVDGGPAGVLPTFTVTDDDKLPEGVSIGPDGRVGGVPAAPGAFEVPVRICVAGNCAGVVVQLLIA
ncbi:hypothetical protein E1286_31175 [Nonomuraea terrae]|uniref:Uncharacterized protein n=2 Tax=Nonomuraea terrae TaxID=2530383 RepID=A0A4R4YC84_9ACTN|nr:hypothetical protein E1286_31175 [Nonomuraea terrae]